LLLSKVRGIAADILSVEGHLFEQLEGEVEQTTQNLDDFFAGVDENAPESGERGDY
jgi:hypothetical protein